MRLEKKRRKLKRRRKRVRRKKSRKRRKRKKMFNTRKTLNKVALVERRSPKSYCIGHSPSLNLSGRGTS